MTRGADPERGGGQRRGAVAIVGGVWWTCVRRRRRSAAEQGATSGQLLGAVAWGEPAVVANPVEARRQHVQQEPPDELGGGERHCLGGPRGLGTIVLVGEPHLAVLDVEQPIIRDRDAVRVAADVGEHLVRTREGALGIDDPVGALRGRQRVCPRRSVTQRVQRAAQAEGARIIGGVEVLQEQATEQAREDPDGEKEPRATRDPASAVGREAAAWDDAMQMGMVDECLTPRVEHREEPDLGAQMLRIGGDSLEGLGGGAKQDRVLYTGDLFCAAIAAIVSGTVNTTWKYWVSRISAVRWAIHAARASDWHLGQCRLAQEL